MKRMQVIQVAIAILLLNVLAGTVPAQFGYYPPAPIPIGPADGYAPIQSYGYPSYGYSSFYAPSAGLVQPVVAYSVPGRSVAPVAAALPVAAYQVPVAAYQVPVAAYRVPVAAYRVPVAGIYSVPVAVVPIATRPVIVRPKVYIPGQPLRNTFRAFTP